MKEAADGSNIDKSTEEKIRSAAKKLFTEKGYSNTTVRDVAEEAVVNVALVNYYFRSKEKLFHSIFSESFEEYSKQIEVVLYSEDLSLEHRIRSFIGGFTDHIKANPHLPMFILSEMRQNPELFLSNDRFKKDRFRNSMLVKQLQEGIQKGEIREIDPLQLENVITSLVLFPALGKPIMQAIHGYDDAKFDAFMDERKQVAGDMIMAYLKKTD